ncbi:MAG: peroxiredoxin family protein [Cryomorphaceae bacterium]|nr:TlpA family protein disulfide reductase [Flavobacteriales bacterium]
MIRLILTIATLVAVAACSNNPESTESRSSQTALVDGEWRFSLKLEQKELPFKVEITGVNTSEPNGSIHNDSEKIPLADVKVMGDSVFLHTSHFDSEFKLRIESPNLMTGAWYNYEKETPPITTIAEFGKDYRFTPSRSSIPVEKQYKVKFYETDSDPWDAILVLRNNEGRLSGTFLTETGDYRYLDGNVMNNSIYLSTFDGSHAFLFQAEIKEDSLINGTFHSGVHYSATWNGVADDEFQLRNPKNLTFLNEGYKEFDFALPNQDGDTVSWKDLNLNGKVVIVDIMGSWCPNCIDANKALKTLLEPYSDDEVKLVNIAFERTENLEKARKSVSKMQKNIGLSEKFIFGGKASKNNAAQKLPSLNHIMSFPTLIFIDKQRNVEQIYTGFYGPGTGKYYDDFMQETEALLKQLVDAPSNGNGLAD